ncbi:hypothetical protein QYE76_053963 [Lolium multiflorum]|uniref:RNase H type-1 domain-containing protein n=1 Tax=Lolium multiflorum TaxID=4521 RepID=A0AAD8SXW7_LOLMU|nr:hypothetical protein QYE76_053963 [Lolium multiflorum]
MVAMTFQRGGPGGGRGRGRGGGRGQQRADEVTAAGSRAPQTYEEYRDMPCLAHLDPATGKSTHTNRNCKWVNDLKNDPEAGYKRARKHRPRGKGGKGKNKDKEEDSSEAMDEDDASPEPKEGTAANKSNPFGRKSVGNYHTFLGTPTVRAKKSALRILNATVRAAVCEVVGESLGALQKLLPRDLRPTYHKFHARACYIYNKLKIPGPNGWITVSGDYKKARDCEEGEAAFAESVISGEELQGYRAAVDPTEMQTTKKQISEQKTSFKAAIETKKHDLIEGATYQRTMQRCLKDQIGRNVHAYVDDIAVMTRKGSDLLSDLKETFDNLRRSNVDPNNVPLASLVAQEENVDVNFIKNNNFNNNAYRNNSGNNYRPYPSANGNGYGNSYGNSYNNNRNVPSGLEAMLKEFISTQTAFNKSVEEKLDKIDTIASRVDRLASDVNLLKLKVMPNNDIDNKITTTANAIQVRINENIRLMAELRARWDREENEKLAKENNVAKVWTITTTSNANSSHVAAPPTINGNIIGVGNVSTPSAKRTKLPEIAKTAETACDKTAEIFSNLGNNDPIAVAHNDLDFDDCHISEVIKFLQKLAKSPNASAINLAFTKHITNALIKAREEKLKLETSIPRKYEALLHGLRIAKEIGIKHIICCGDSNLVAQQVAGTWNARNSVMAAYRDEVDEIAKCFLGYEVKYVRRDDNTAADMLSKLGSGRNQFRLECSLSIFEYPR